MIEGLLERFEGAPAESGGPEAALPDDYGVPAEAGEGLVVTAVALAVALYLRAPEVDVGLGEAEVAAAFVAVPEAAVDEDTGAVLAKDDVGVAGQARMVEPVRSSRAWCQPNGWPPCSYAAAEGTSYPYSANLVNFRKFEGRTKQYSGWPDSQPSDPTRASPPPPC